MANEMALFKSGAQLPDYLREGPDDFTKQVAGGNSGKSVSIKGGVWRMIIGGEEIARNEDRGMNFVVVNAARHVARTFYADVYEEGKEVSPACFSADGKTPDTESEDAQSSSCATCPQNIAGSGQNNSRACRFSRRIAVVLEGDIGGNVYRLQLPAKSMFGKGEGDKMPFDAYAKHLAGHGIPMSGIVTEIRFDTAEAVPVLKFRAIRPLTREEVAVSREQMNSEGAAQAIETKAVTVSKVKTPTPLPQTFVQEDAPAPVKTKEAVEPTKRASKKTEPSAPPKDVGSILSEWGSDDE